MAVAVLLAGCIGGEEAAREARMAELAAEGSRIFPRTTARGVPPPPRAASDAGHSKPEPEPPSARASRSTSKSGKQRDNPAATAAKVPAADRPNQAGWSIVLATFSDPNPEVEAERARRALWTAQTSAGLIGAFLERRSGGMALAYGRYQDPRSAEAQADLQRVRAITLEGERPFAAAVVAPPPGPDASVAGEFDLRGVKRRYGDRALYTLQVGAYMRADRKPASEPDLAAFARAAEEAARRLRRDGDEAFYYHGPNGSMVTVGLFGQEDVGSSGTGPRVELLRQRHPYNLVNGEAYRVRVRGVPESDPGAWRLQTSSLVEIPNE